MNQERRQRIIGFISTLDYLKVKILELANAEKDEFDNLSETDALSCDGQRLLETVSSLDFAVSEIMDGVVFLKEAIEEK